MKHIQKLWFFLLAAGMLFTACEKNIEGGGEIAVFSNGKQPVISASAATIAPAAADSNNVALTLSWTNPEYSIDSSTVKYVVEIDSTNRNFSKSVTRTVTGTRRLSMLAKELNSILLGFGFAFNTAYDIDVRVISSFPNNNERLVSNTLKLRVTPYKIPPRIALPASGRLFVVGDAFNGIPDWDNPTSLPWPAFRELTRTSETVWEGVFNMKGSGSYLILPQFGNVWSNKISVRNNTVSGLANGGDFGVELPDNIPGNVSGGAGWYRLRFDFQFGTFTVTRISTDGYRMPDQLWITGDAAPNGWVNNPANSQRFTPVTNGVFTLDIALAPGKLYKFLSTNGAWQPQYGGNSATGGNLGFNYGPQSDPDAVPTPATAGNYRINVDFISMKYTVTRL